MDYLIGLDIGTSAVKGVLTDLGGKVVQSKSKKLSYYYKNGLKLLDADKFCDVCFEVIKELVCALPQGGNIAALCASGASGNLMFVKNGESCSPVFGWQNQIAEDITNKHLSALTAEDVYNTVGWHKINSFPLAVLAYVKEKTSELISAADTICMHIEYLNFKLTGKWGITVSMGTPFYLINQTTGSYNKEYLEIFGIKEGQLPPIMDNCAALGGINSFAAEKTGLSAGTPVVLGTFDHPSAARGAGVFDENQVLLSCGTSWVLLLPFADRKTPLSKKMLIDRFMYPNGNWCGMVSLSSVSEKIKMYINKYLGDITDKEFDELAEKSVYGANGLTIDAIEDNADRYAKSDIARAIMESIAKELGAMLKRANVGAEEMTAVGGITNSAIWTRVISEITGKKIKIVNGEHAGAVGAAAMAGVGAGIFKNEREAFQSKGD
jgi:sugar (pentulose or hexulose) kinase